MSKKLLIAVFLLSAAFACSVLMAADINSDSLDLFSKKCSSCHSLKRVFNEHSSIWSGNAAGVVSRMQEKKPSWISVEEAADITSLLEANSREDLKTAIEKAEESSIIAGDESKTESDDDESSAGTSTHDEDESEEHGDFKETLEHIIKPFHGVLNGFLFFSFALYLALSGLNRFATNRKRNSISPVKFEWKKHVAAGRLFLPLILAGFMGGICIFFLDDFHIGAPLHFWGGIAIAILYLIGGIIGINMAKGQSKSLRTLHAICNLSATVLFAINVITGMIEFLG